MKTMNRSVAPPPTRPSVRPSRADVIPVITSDTTSGITVMRIAFTQSAPIGSTSCGTGRSTGTSSAEITIPSTSARARARPMRAVSDMRVPLVATIVGNRSSRRGAGTAAPVDRGNCRPAREDHVRGSVLPQPCRAEGNP
jgi:hypothetical protein